VVLQQQQQQQLVVVVLLQRKSLARNGRVPGALSRSSPSIRWRCMVAMQLQVHATAAAAAADAAVVGLRFSSDNRNGQQLPHLQKWMSQHTPAVFCFGHRRLRHRRRSCHTIPNQRLQQKQQGQQKQQERCWNPRLLGILDTSLPDLLLLWCLIRPQPQPRPQPQL
jgi:hypothetical protein